MVRSSNPQASQLVVSVSNGHGPANRSTTDERIRRVIQRAIDKCGSAAELARRLQVKAPTVSQWRNSGKKPDAHHLVKIQDIAGKMATVLLACAVALLQPADAAFNKTSVSRELGVEVQNGTTSGG